MKPVSEWDEAYILSLPVGEFDWLEAKGRRSLDLTIPNVTEDTVLATISKEVSAFANSGGGTLVYGLIDPKAGDTEWHVNDGGVSVTVKRGGTKEWLETVIPNQMDPPLEKFNVYAIPPSGPGTKIDEGRALFVVEVPDSQQAPHQAKDYKYYSRVASRAQPIRHRQVLDILSRRQHPEIRLRFRLNLRGSRTQEEGEKQSLPDATDFLEAITSSRADERLAANIPALEVAAFNSGRTYAEYVHITVYIPVELTPEETVFSSITFKHLSAIRPMNGRNYQRYMLSNYGKSGTEPLLPSLGVKYFLPLRPSIFSDGTLTVNDNLLWFLQADHGPISSGVIALSDTEIRDERR